MEGQTLLVIMLAILGFNFALEKVLGWLNARMISEELPPELEGIYDAAEYARSQQYIRERSKFGFWASLVSFVGMVAVLLTGALGWLDEGLRTTISDPWWLALAFFGVLVLVNDLISLPFSIYSTFVIEAKYGFNTTTARTFILDKVKGYLIGAVLGGGLLLLFMWLVDQLGPDFWWWFWLAMAAFSIGLNLFYTSLLLPLFNKLEPLRDGTLRDKIVAYAESVGFNLSRIMVMDGSRRSQKANAFFSGFGPSKRVVLYDTLIEQMDEEEVVAVLAHEVGHYKKRHIIGSLIMSLLTMGIMLFVLSRLIMEPALSEALGASVPGLHLSLVAFALLYSPISQLIGIGFNLISRKNEYEADAYAASTYAAAPLGSALVKLHVKTLSNLRPHPAHVFLNYSHPTLLQRLAAMGVDPAASRQEAGPASSTV